MDPRECLRLALDALNALETDPETFHEHADNYNEWIERGGFPARIQLAPHTDEWMQGDRFADVLAIGSGVNGRIVRAKLDKSGRVLTLAKADFTQI